MTATLLKHVAVKIQNLGLKIPHCGEIWSKVETLNTHNVLCRKFAAIRRQIATFCPSYFLAHDAAEKTRMIRTL